MKPNKKNIHGILLFDKPQGLTSNQAMQKIKWLFGAQKAGHTGSLDPMATGVLPICFGEATKFAHYGLDADKTYQATLKLGETTSTGDSEGEVIHCAAVPAINQTRLDQIQQKFSGPQQQVPPMYSALKKEGVPLYRLARQGIEVEREARNIVIYQLEVKQSAADILELMVTCSKGTYIRSLAEDIGQFLGCGAHLIALRRTAVSHFAAPLFTYEQLQAMDGSQREVCLLPIDAMVTEFPRLELDAVASDKLFKGQTVSLDLSPLVTVRLYNEAGIFLGVGEVDDAGILRSKRLVNLIADS